MYPRGGVYFAALVSRFAKTCARRAGSASTARSGRDVDRQVVLALLDERAGHLQRARQHVAEIDAHALERDLAARDARHLEQVVDQSHQVLDLALDDGALLEQDVAGAQLHQLQRGRDRRQRVAQLVPEHGQEFVLGAAGRLRLDRLGLERLLRQHRLGDVLRDADDAVDACRPRRAAGGAAWSGSAGPARRRGPRRGPAPRSTVCGSPVRKTRARCSGIGESRSSGSASSSGLPTTSRSPICARASSLT